MVEILVAYATRNGSTAQVAQVLAEVLRAGPARVDVRPARSVREPVDIFDLVVLGAPPYSGRWHRDAHWFLKQHRTELERVPVAVFAMGPRTDEKKAWLRSRAQLDRALARRGWLVPVAVAMFGGVDPSARRPGGARRDVRDWSVIRSWAQDLREAGALVREPSQ